MSSCLAAKTLKREEINISKEAFREKEMWAMHKVLITVLKNGQVLIVLEVSFIIQAEITKTMARMHLHIPSYNFSHPLSYVRCGPCGEKDLVSHLQQAIAM